MLPLSSTPNKQVIRRRWDRPIIEDFSKRIGKKLDYFGLPGPDIWDYLDWKETLGWKTGIEYASKRASNEQRQEQSKRLNELQTQVMLNDLGGTSEVRRGTLEDIILSGVDIDSKRPRLLTGEKNMPSRMKYDLHNWDFQGGLYKNKKSESKRVEAIKHCIKLQKDHPFLFLLTLNVRHTLGDEISTYLNGAADDISSVKHKEVLGWYSNRGRTDNTEHYRIKAVVPLFIRTIAQVNSFDCYCYPPIYYEGWKEHLLHFVFELTPKGTVLPTYSTQLTNTVIELPLIKVKNGEFVLVEQQHPYFSSESLETLLQNGLPISEVLRILSL